MIKIRTYSRRKSQCFFFLVDFTHSWGKLCIILFYSCKEFEINGLLKGVVLSMCICLCRSGASRFFMKVLRAAPAFLFSKSSSAVLRNTIKFLLWEVSSREFWVCLCYVSALCRLFKVSRLSLWFIFEWFHFRIWGLITCYNPQQFRYFRKKFKKDFNG